MTRYIVPISGGKDSQLVLSMAVDEHGQKDVIAVHHFTGIDHPLTYKHMNWMARFYGVHFETSTHQKYSDVFDLIEKRDMIPGRMARLCTDEFKIAAFNKWLLRQPDLDQIVMLMGMRQQESPDRSVRYGDLSPDDEFSLRDLNPRKILKKLAVVRVRLPIVDKSTPWVYEQLRMRGEKINPLYARGHHRVGCYPCLLAGMRDFRLAARDPVGREHIIRLDQLRDELVARKGIKKTDKIWEHMIGGKDLKKILAENAPGKHDPFGFDAGDDAEGDEGGCAWCER
jgi:3'-phosphoadenosine 5'-phosphosulfate sulfotransferase (PAPS reductase)/FAD synthetase